jgi:hypothetical protein
MKVAALFGADPPSLMAANAFDFAAPGAAHRILPMSLFVRVPTRCACADGVRKSVSVRYAARPGDTLATVADIVFAGLASADQIRDENSLASADPDAPLDAGQKLAVPLPASASTPPTTTSPHCTSPTSCRSGTPFQPSQRGTRPRSRTS